MGVNARWYAPAGTRLDTVRDAIAVLCGAKVILEKVNYDSPQPSAQYMDEDGRMHFLSRLVKASPTACPEMVSLQWDLPLSGQQSLYWHFESERGMPVTCPRSRGFYIALLTALCNFMGGDLQFSDCDDEFEVHAPRPWFLDPAPLRYDGEVENERYYAYQRALAELQPLTLADLERGEWGAAYDGDLEDMRGLFVKKSKSILSEPVTTRKSAGGKKRNLLTEG